MARTMRQRRARWAALVLLATAAVMLGASTAQAATLTVKPVTSRFAYKPGSKIVVRATAQRGATLVTSSRLASAKVTLTNPAGTKVISSATMTKDAATGLATYAYTLPTTAPKGTWKVGVSVTDTSGNAGTAQSTFRIRVTVPDHSTYFTSYAGPQTCLKCHPQAGSDMFGSVHYQFKGDTSKAIELAGTSNASKLGGINDFCIWPDGNWLTVFSKLDGTKGPGGCAVCHTGLGLKPSSVMSTEQLNNIDCLMCHSRSYKRVVSQLPDGTFRLVADPTIDLQKAAKDLTFPGRAECLRCHQGAGGGDNYKRGDIESTLKSCPKTYDVHMGTDGQDFLCIDCHRTERHRIAGRGSDMRAQDSTLTLRCESCHTTVPHRSSNTAYADLNRHTARLDCTVCHIPAFAKSVPTDMVRDWREMEVDTAKQLYDPMMVKQTNVKPKYAWYNGLSHFYRFGDPVKTVGGVLKMSWPDGSFADASAKLFPFKVHAAFLPIESTTKTLLPLKNKIAFETGNVNAAIAAGAAAAGLPYASHTFQQTERWMGIYHGVGPKNTALSCSNQPCHGSQDRIPFKQLGYTTRAANSVLCSTCHEGKTYTGFVPVHDKHRSKAACTACHGAGAPLKEAKATLCDNCHSPKTAESTSKLHKKHAEKGYACSACHTFSGK